jgi:transcriptional regulator with XRE-family HTH domain
MKFDGDAFVAALDAERQARKATWRRVAQESGVSASTLSRLSQGMRPDVDSLAQLCSWARLSSDLFLRRDSHSASSLTEVIAQFRADPNLTKESAIALETLIKVAYENLRKK